MLKIRMVVEDTSTGTEWEEELGTVPDGHLEQAAAGGALVDVLAQAALAAAPTCRASLEDTVGRVLREAGAVVASRLAGWKPQPVKAPPNGGIVVPSPRPE
jgi:hypothetical protein